MQYYRSSKFEYRSTEEVQLNVTSQMYDEHPAGSNYNTTLWFCCSHISGRPPLDRGNTTNRILTLSNHILTLQSYVAVCTGTGNWRTVHSVSNSAPSISAVGFKPSLGLCHV